MIFVADQIYVMTNYYDHNSYFKVMFFWGRVTLGVIKKINMKVNRHNRIIELA